jgi:hypothetical protein
VRRLQRTDEQLSSVFNQSWQAIVDYLQLSLNILQDLNTQTAGLELAITNLENNYISQNSALQIASNNAAQPLADANSRQSAASNLNTQNSASLAKITAANTSLSVSENNLNLVQTNGLLFNPLLQAIANLGTRPANQLLGTDEAGTGVRWIATGTGQSWILEMGAVSYRVAPGSGAGSIPAGTWTAIPFNSSGYINCRNNFGIVEVVLGGSTVNFTCTGNNCRYYFFSLATSCGTGGLNTRVKLDSTVQATGGAAQTIAGRSLGTEDFNVFSSGFGAVNVGSGSPRLGADAIVQAAHPSFAAAALGRTLDSGNAEVASLLFVRRRMQ